ncbi:MAG: AAA family ATPase, partial [Bacteroidales bacterium]|nr:AAA family ATPase [Bacteroidales bacterium]
MEDLKPPILSRLPLSLQSFEDLRKRNYIYVDKTQYVYMLVNQGKSYFLARPRRFGKSLLCNTLRAYFEGKRELFEGLKIYNWEKNWTKYPILYLDFADGDYSIGSLTLVNKIRTALINFEAENGIAFDESSIIINEETDPLKNEAT